ncbi:MAG: CoA transferase [Acidimicrobiia bacterium]
MESPNGPLAGVRVVDAGDATLRWAGKLLADAGADVVRVRRGLPGPSLGDVGGGHGVLAWWLDGGTRYVDAPPHSDGFRALVARADILLESEPPGTLDGAQLRADNPSLVHVALTPFGQDGPRASWRSSDLVAAALGGVLSVNGLPDEPLPIWGRQTETVGGLYAASAALAGLCSVRAGGGGLSIDLSLQQAVMACTEHLFMFWWHPERLAPFGAPEAVRQGSLHWVRGYEVMNCARGACMVSPTAGGVFDLITYLQAEGFGTDLPAVPTPTEMLARVEQYMAALRQLAATKDATELFEKGQAMHVPFGEVLTVAQVVRNAQLTARGFFRPVPGADERLRIPGPMARFSRTPLRSPAPPPGAATEVQDVVQQWGSGPASMPDDEHRSVEPPSTQAMASVPGDRRPLAGLRVLDFTHVLAGPFATRLLGDLGADIVKIQTTERAQGGSANDFPYFPMWNRNKRSVTLDMTHPDALGVFRRLVEQADVVIDNFSAGVLEHWGCGPDVLASWNPGVVSISMTGCGGDGPWRSYVTYAPTVHALCGLTALTGPPGRIDVGTGIALNDHTSGLLGAFAVLSALEARQRTGLGQHIDLSQLETGAMLVAPALMEHLATGREVTAGGLADPFDPTLVNLVVQAADGEWLAATVSAGDGEHAAGERAQVEAMAAAHGAHEAMERLQAAGIAAGAVQGARELTGVDPQLAHRGAFLALDSPLWGTQHTDRYPGVVRDASGVPIELTYTHAPYLGEHTFEVAAELLGMDAEAVAEAMGSGLFS